MEPTENPPTYNPPMQLHLKIDDLQLAFRPGPAGDPRKPRPALDAPTAAQLQLVIERTEVEHALERFAEFQARDWSVDIQNLRVAWTTPSPRTLAATATARATKGILGATVTISGRAELTAPLTLRLHDLTCTGEGLAGNLLAPLVTARLREHDGRTIDLSNKVPPWLQVRDAILSATEDRFSLQAVATARDPSPS